MTDERERELPDHHSPLPDGPEETDDHIGDPIDTPIVLPGPDEPELPQMSRPSSDGAPITDMDAEGPDGQVYGG